MTINKKYKIFVFILLLFLLFIVIYNFSKEKPICNIHGSFVSKENYCGQQVMVFDKNKMKYYRFINSTLSEEGSFKNTEIENIFFLNSDINDTYIVLNGDYFFLVDKSTNNIIHFEKDSDSLIYFGEKFIKEEHE